MYNLIIIIIILQNNGKITILIFMVVLVSLLLNYRAFILVQNSWGTLSLFVDKRFRSF